MTRVYLLEQLLPASPQGGFDPVATLGARRDCGGGSGTASRTLDPLWCLQHGDIYAADALRLMPITPGGPTGSSPRKAPFCDGVQLQLQS